VEKNTQKSELQVKDLNDRYLIKKVLTKTHIIDLGEMKAQFEILKKYNVDHNNYDVINQYLGLIFKYYLGFNKNLINNKKDGKIT